ncbi:lipase secretion chaperone [Photobacterium sanguinicancri]|uniref:Lipase chaperone n=1 Tax=Photobacterium sanguinicancri TaxID=875932 RepID=A0ABX4G394_9GAMM|nr:lipase secretion chaperone [Photobacterium sanguinicancri]OZS45497.1 lipase chaperone [Photobacterium sanguinicancri]
MKKTVLLLLCIVGVACAVYFNFESPTKITEVQVHSQQDTDIDKDSARDTFDYFLAGLGEEDLKTLKANFLRFNQEQAEGYQLDEDLFKRFIEYRAALADLESGAFQNLDFNALQQLDDQLLALQLRYFSAAEQQTLFANENTMRQLALIQLRLKEQFQDKETYQQAWQQELDQLSPDLQQGYRNASLLTEIHDTEALDDQNRYLQQQALVGTEAADRLEQLRTDRKAFQLKLDNYLAQRADIAADPTLDTDAQLTAIDDLRRQTFSANQQRRVRALESMENLPKS